MKQHSLWDKVSMHETKTRVRKNHKQSKKRWCLWTTKGKKSISNQTCTKWNNIPGHQNETTFLVRHSKHAWNKNSCDENHKQSKKNFDVCEQQMNNNRKKSTSNQTCTKWNNIPGHQTETTFLVRHSKHAWNKNSCVPEEINMKKKKWKTLNKMHEKSNETQNGKLK